MSRFWLRPAVSYGIGIDLDTVSLDAGSQVVRGSRAFEDFEVSPYSLYVGIAGAQGVENGREWHLPPSLGPVRIRLQALAHLLNPVE